MHQARQHITRLYHLFPHPIVPIARPIVPDQPPFRQGKAAFLQRRAPLCSRRYGLGGQRIAVKKVVCMSRKKRKQLRKRRFCLIIGAQIKSEQPVMAEIIPRNPADLVPFARPKPKSERTSLTPEEAARLFQYAEEEGGAYGTALMLLIATGMRRGEVLGLMWKYVDLGNEQLEVAHQYGTDKELRRPKTDKSRRPVSIKGYIAEALKAWKAQQEIELAKIGKEQTGDTPVFTSELGTFIDPNNFDRWWRNFSVDNGFGEFTRDVRTNRMNGKEVTRGKGYKGLKVHELRHTQATLVQGLVNPKAAQHRLGHSQLSMTMNTYAHALDADEIRAAEAMDEILRPKKTV